MNKEIFKKIIVENQEFVQSRQIVERDITLDDNLNYVFVGLRRAGKSYLMFQYIHKLMKHNGLSIQQILYINFEDERISSFQAQELGLLLDAYKEMFDYEPIVFLDEIQNIAGWEKFARRLADQKYRVFVTGSNAKMLSKEIHTTLGGRFLIQEVFPFSFEEFLRFHKINLTKNWEYGELSNRVFKYFQTYFYYGGFAETFNIDEKRLWLNSLYQKILLGDIIARNEIRNDNAIRILAKKLAECVMQPTALNRLKNIIETAGVPVSRVTMVDYLNYFSDAYMVFGVSNFVNNLSEKETIKKRYFFDNGLLNSFLFDPETKLLENIVAIHLVKKFGENLFFYNKNIEVDFYIPSEKTAIQVSYSVTNADTENRETAALIKLAERFEVEKLLIITFNEERQIAVNNKVIFVIPVWKWLLRHTI